MRADSFFVGRRPGIRRDAVAADLERTAHPLVRLGGGIRVIDAEPRREFRNRRVRRIAQGLQFPIPAEKAQHMTWLHRRVDRPRGPLAELQQNGRACPAATEQFLHP
ncbi:hypothetical protein [Burkholderia cepacia]|uniref:hypothetical protein n=1 Tax=Burkholderia cepacia TaxID=292 RepID=UPI0018C551AE|nr:hypothetical protein [Burkholderia cepacia]